MSISIPGLLLAVGVSVIVTFTGGRPAGAMGAALFREDMNNLSRTALLGRSGIP